MMKNDLSKLHLRALVNLRKKISKVAAITLGFVCTTKLKVLININRQNPLKKQLRSVTIPNATIGHVCSNQHIPNLNIMSSKIE